MHGYYLPWVLLIVVSLWVSLAGFVWALSHGQFSEQERARYLPLRDELGAIPKQSGAFGRREIIAPIAVLGIGGLVMAAVVILLCVLPGGR